MWRLLIITLLVPNLSFAEGFKHREKLANAPPLPKIEFYCTDSKGDRRELGEVICITASCKTWLAKCDMSLNNVMWREIQQGCPTASAIERLNRLRPTTSRPEAVMASARSKI